MQGGTARTGVWIIGSRGSVATTAITGAAAVTAGLATTTGLVTMRPPFTEAGLPALGDLVFGGHDLVETPLAVRAARLVDGGVLPDRLPEAVAAQLAAAESEMRPGITFREARSEPLAAVARIGADLAGFRERHQPRPHRRHQPLLDRAAGRAASRPRRPRRADGRAAPRPRHPPAELALRAGRDRAAAAPSSTSRRRPARASRRSRRSPSAPACRSAAATARRARRCSRRRSRRCSPRARCACARGRAPTCSATATASRSPTRSAPQSKLNTKARSARGDPRLPARADRPIDYVPRPRRLEDRLGPHHLRGLPRRADDAAVHLAGLRLALAAPLVLDLARLASLALERGAAGVVPELGFFFKDPAGTTSTRWSASTRSSRSGRRRRSPREGARARRRRGARPPPCRPLRPR